MGSSDHVVWEKLGAGSGQRSLVESSEHVVWDWERADDWEQRQAREVWSQGSTQEITPAILSDSNRIVRTR